MDVPRVVRRPEDGDVGLVVAVVVGGNRHVAARPERGERVGAASGGVDVPRAVRWPEYGDVGLAVAVVVAGHGDVASRPPDRDRVGAAS